MPETRHAGAPIYPAGAPHAKGRLPAGFRIGGHRHEQGQLVYSAAGALATTTERGTWIAPADRVTWTPPGFVHAHRCYGQTDVRIVVIPVELCGELRRRPAVFGVSPLLRQAILAMTERRAIAPAAYRRLRQVVLDELVEVAAPTLQLPDPSDDRLRRVAEVLHADPGRPVTLAELGRIAGASERTLSRLFHAELGMSFHRWRTLLRIHHALVHLADGRSVTATAIECGWSNPTSFIEAFTEVIGQTPGRYRAGSGPAPS
jgi:AraC-like DNA-binding protein